MIGGWAESDTIRSFRSLLFGAYNTKGKLEWIGRSGGGFTEAEMPVILKKLKANETSRSPFCNKVIDSKAAKIHWVKPVFVANFEFAAWTKSGRIRKPATWLGFRNDKNPLDIVREVPKTKKELRMHTEKKTVVPIPLSTELRSMDGFTITLTHLDRPVWKNITKRKLIDYYTEMSPFILPYLKNRPLSLLVHPHGAKEAGFFLRDMAGRLPACAEDFCDTRRHPREGKPGTIHYMVCNNSATLIWLINFGCIDINPWMAQTGHPEEPDMISLDLDPGDRDFEKVIITAKAIRKELEKYRLVSFVKTSGKTGLHIYIPVRGVRHPEARAYAEFFGNAVVKKIPHIATTEKSILARGKKVYIDPSQNDHGDTLACVYSVRPNKLPTVSAPLSWREVRKGLDPSVFTIDTIKKRIQTKGDLFAGVLDDKLAIRNTKQLPILTH